MSGRRLRPVPDTPPRVGRYIRVSRVMGRTDEKFLSPDLQDDALTRQIDARFGPGGYVDAGTFIDLDVSGGTMDRRSLDDALALARAGELDYLAVYELSRWSRDTEGGLAGLRELDRMGCRLLRAGRDVDLGDPDDEFSVSIDLAIATRQRKQIGKQWQRVIGKRAERGLWHGGAPLGYVRAGGTLAPDPLMAPLVVDLFAGYAAGRPVAELVREFDAARVDGRATWQAVLKRTLRNPAYLGLVAHDGQVLPGRHPALVDDTTWQRVARRIERDSTTAPRLLHPTHALSGLLVCVLCERVMSRDVRADSPGGQLVVRVKCAHRAAPRPCPGVGRPLLEPIEAVVLGHIRALGEQLRVDDGARLARRARKATAGAELTALRRELARTEEAEGRLAVAWARREITSTAHRAAAGQLEGALTALRSRLAELEVAAAAPGSRDASRHARSAAERWDRMTPAERNVAARLLISRVRVRPPAYYREPVEDRVLEPEWV